MQTAREYTVDDMVNFAWLHRRKKAFFLVKDIEDIRKEIWHSLGRNCFAFCTDVKTGDVIGIVTGDVEPEDKLFYVKNILTTQRRVLALLLDKFSSLYPGYKLEARRHGKVKHYNTKKFLLKVNRLTINNVI